MEGESLKKLTDEQIEERIKSNLSELLSNPKFLEEFKMRLLSRPASLRQEFVNKILGAVKMNNESVSTSLTTKKGMRLPPTVSNWLKDYLGFVGEEINDNKKEEYINTSEFKSIEEENQNVLKNLFDFYKILHSASKTPENLDTVVVKDRSGKLKILKKGEFIDLTKPQVEIKEEVSKAPKETLPTPELEPEPKKAIMERLDRDKEETKKKAAAPSYFHPEDADEIKSRKEELSSYSLPEFQDLDDTVQKVITQNNLTFADDILKKRYESIARSRLKEIRNERDTLDLLTRSTKIGGLGFSEEQGKKILEDLNKEIAGLAKLKPKKEEKKPEISPPSPAEALQRALKEKEVFKPAPPVEEKIPSVEEGPKPIPPREVEKSETSQAQLLYGKAMKDLKRKTELQKKREKEEAQRPKSPRTRITRPPATPQKPRVEDIKGKPKVLGPVEELRDLKLNDFRRLGTDKVSSGQKVYDKISLLREDSFPKFAAGVKAWRESEVHKTYLRMGHESLEKGKTIREIIEESKSSGTPYLTESEFNTIADLNKKIRF